jgi:hypothetical protein
MPIAPLNVAPTAPAANEFDFAPLAKLGEQMKQQQQIEQLQSLASLAQAPSAPPSDGSVFSTGSGVSYSPRGGGDYASAISRIESGGNYAELGPTTGSGDRAYGKYQIMGNNIPEWSRAALGRSVTPQEFLANPQLQDTIFKHRFGQYVDKYGPGGAARAWFAGEGGMNNPNAKDQLGTSVASYERRFLGGL